MGHRPFCQFLHLDGLAYVGDHIEHVGAFGPQPPGGLGQGRRLDIGDHHLHLFGAEPPGHGQADTAGAARDYRYLAPQFFHVSSVRTSSSRRPGRPRPGRPFLANNPE